MNSMIRLVKNPTHITVITSPPKPDLALQQLVKNAKITYCHHKCQTTGLWCRWV